MVITKMDGTFSNPEQKGKLQEERTLIMVQVDNWIYQDS